MEHLHPRLLALLTLLAVAFAGCANNVPGGDPTDVAPPPVPSTAEAQALLRKAAEGTEGVVTTRALLTQGSRVLLSLNGTFDNTTDTAYLEMRGDPEAFKGGDDSPGGDEFAAAIKDGLVLYVTSAGSLYLVNGTALVFPATEDAAAGGSFIPRPDESPFAAFLQPEQAFAGLKAANATVQEVRGTVLRGQPAIELDVTAPGADGNGTNEASITLFVDPVRIGRIEGTAPRDPDNPADPFGGSLLVADFYYEGDTLQPSEAARRALGLGYRSDRTFFGQGDAPVTMTFLASAAIPLAEVEVQVKDTSSADPSDVTGVSALPTLWTMRLSEANRTQGGITVTFTDADGDNMVSRNDTLVVSGQGADGQPPTVVLYDTKTGTYVVPGPGALLGLVALGAAGLALRRRAR